MPRLKRGFALIELLIVIAIVGLLCALAIPKAQAQDAPPAPTTDPISVLQNLPQSSLSNEAFGITIGSVMQGAASGFESEMSGRFCFKDYFAVKSSIQTGKGNTSVDTFGLGFEVRKAWQSYEINGGPFARRNWSLNKWEGGVEAGVIYKPFTTGTFKDMSFELTPRLVVSGIKERPAIELVFGPKWSF